MAVTKEEKQTIFTEFGINSQDTGSSQVQVALLTKDIVRLTEHWKKIQKILARVEVYYKWLQSS